MRKIVTDQMIVNVSASETNVFSCRSMLSFATTMQYKRATIRDSVYIQTNNNEDTEFIMDKSVMS